VAQNGLSSSADTGGYGGGLEIAGVDPDVVALRERRR
jgi:hypothetical protein